MFRFVLPLLLVIASPSLLFAQEFKSRPELLEQCLNKKKPQFHQSCIGLMANDCMANNDGGETTVGMGSCAEAERIFWDVRLNKVYKQLVRAEEKNDSEAKSEGWNAPEKLAPLRDMQRKWIGYRDALCDYEYSQWGGGTGGGPAITSCLMSETARQALILESYLSYWER